MSGKSVLEQQMLDAQVGVLGSMLIDDSTIGTVLQKVQPDDFRSAEYRTVFQAIKNRFTAGQPVDAVLVRGDIGADYSDMLRGLMELTPTSANVGAYIDQLKEAAALYRLQTLGSAISLAVTLDDAQSLLDKMQFCYIRDGVSLVMPVTPESYKWIFGRQIQTINISELGDVNIPGGKSLYTGSAEYLLPVHDYDFMEPGSTPNPNYYLNYLLAWLHDGRPVRFMVTGTVINHLVLLESVDPEERDGSGDVYCTVAMREYINPDTPTVSESNTKKSNASRARTSSGTTGGRAYTIRRGDTLSAICRRFYGSSSSKYYKALAKYNGIKNPNLVYPGKTIKIPPASTLLR